MRFVPVLLPGESYRAAIARFTRELVAEALRQHATKTAAARALGLTREGLWRMTKRVSEPREGVQGVQESRRRAS